MASKFGRKIVKNFTCNRTSPRGFLNVKQIWTCPSIWTTLCAVVSMSIGSFNLFGMPPWRSIGTFHCKRPECIWEASTFFGMPLQLSIGTTWCTLVDRGCECRWDHVVCRSLDFDRQGFTENDLNRQICTKTSNIATKSFKNANFDQIFHAASKRTIFHASEQTNVRALIEILLFKTWKSSLYDEPGGSTFGPSSKLRKWRNWTYQQSLISGKKVVLGDWKSDSL